MMTLGRASGLTESEVHNYLLQEIHNRLADISRFLEVITVKYADLNSNDVDVITRANIIAMHCPFSSTSNCPEENRKYELRMNEHSPIGYTADKKLHIAEDDFDFYKLSNEETARPVNDDDYNYFLTDEEIEERWGKEGLMAIKKRYNPISYSRKKTSK